VATENIIVGNGSVEIIWLVAWAYLRPGDTVLIIGPTFGEYERASRIAGARVIAYGARAERGFQPDVAEVIGLIQKERPRLIFLCNPNNPTGVYLGREAVEHLAHASPDSLLIIDEAYVNFVEERWPSIPLIERGNVLVLRSMTKDYALAGLRLGYGVAAPDIINTLSRIQPPWSVNAMAQQAGIFVLSQEKYVRECQVRIKEAKAYLVTELTRLGLLPLHSEASFLLVRVGDATEFRRRLLQHKILVRDCTSFGFPDYIRLAPRTMPECQRLVKVIKEMRRVEK
jgi:histidinol-phosphate aminotransferase